MYIVCSGCMICVQYKEACCCNGYIVIASIMCTLGLYHV